MTKTKQQKQHERRKEYERQRNLAHYQPKPKYVLQVKELTGWRTVMRFFSREEVDQHVEHMEDLRRRNVADIVEAVVVDVKKKKPLLRIEPHKMTDPAILGVQAPPEPEKKPVEAVV
jgi:hypothetical protein